MNVKSNVKIEGSVDSGSDEERNSVSKSRLANIASDQYNLKKDEILRQLFGDVGDLIDGKIFNIFCL
jgi:hypothetical protein